MTKSKFTKAQKAKAVKLAAKVGLRQAAVTTGVSYNTVRNWKLAQTTQATASK